MMARSKGPVIVRTGAELSTKQARTRQRFFNALKKNVSEALKRRGIHYGLRCEYGRFFIDTPAPDEVCDALRYVFGLGSFSPVELVTRAELGEIVERGGRAFADRVRNRRYAVRAMRQGSHSFKSSDISRELGSALNAEATVDLGAPDVTVYVEVLGDRAYLFTERTSAAGGMPSAVQGRALALMSGGFDSAVAAWRIIKRGAALDYVFFNLGGRAYARMVLQVSKVLTDLWVYGHSPRLHLVDFNAAAEAMKQTVKPQYWQVVLKRMMYRAAERVAREIGAQALITGESLGQVSSQTLANLAAIDTSVELPVLRPLIGFDKTEIIKQARHIGTAWLSEKIKEYCALTPQHPVTATEKDRLDYQEDKVDFEPLWNAVQNRTGIDLLKVAGDELIGPYLFAAEIPPRALLIDCQPEYMYQSWHAPGAEHRAPEELARNFKLLDKNRTYVLYCTYGVQTPYLAELMQQHGYEAYAFEGGISSLRRWFDSNVAALTP
jgi:thiamine biosynthesis protein ThiI